MNLELLDDTLAALDQPAFRARQVWEWTARGAAGYEEMSNLPRALRDNSEIPFVHNFFTRSTPRASANQGA